MTGVVVFKNSGRLRLYLELFGGKCQVSAAVLPHITETSWKCSAPTEVTKGTGRAERRLSADSIRSRVKADTSLTPSIQFEISENLQSRAHGEEI